VLVGGGGGLLAALGDIGIEIKAFVTLEVIEEF
jgi:hypothetical protein